MTTDKWLESAMNQSLFNLLGRAYYHDDIMVAGDLGRIFKFTEQDAPVSFALETIRNHLLELSNNMHVEFISTIAFLSALMLKHCPDEHRFEKALQLSMSALYKISPDPSVNSDKVCYTITLIADVLSSSVLNVKPDVVNPNSA